MRLNWKLGEIVDLLWFLEITGNSNIFCKIFCGSENGKVKHTTYHNIKERQGFITGELRWTHFFCILLQTLMDKKNSFSLNLCFFPEFKLQKLEAWFFLTIHLALRTSRLLMDPLSYCCPTYSCTMN